MERRRDCVAVYKCKESLWDEAQDAISPLLFRERHLHTGNYWATVKLSLNSRERAVPD